jgi:hypothetical protein
MPSPLDLPLEELSPAGLWSALDEVTRRDAALSLYRGEWNDPAGRQEADAAIAAAVRFRPLAVRKLPLEKRIGYLLKVVRPDDSLATSLLLALHLDRRRPLLKCFLDRLGIPQEDGMIDPDHEVDPPGVERLREAVASLRDGFPDPEVDLYLASLLAMEPDTWGGLTELFGKGSAV